MITLLAKHDYDLVLADLKMPEINGPAFYQMLKESCRGATPQVIFSLQRGYTPEYANFLMRLAAPVLMKPLPRRRSAPGGGAPSAFPRPPRRSCPDAPRLAAGHNSARRLDHARASIPLCNCAKFLPRRRSSGGRAGVS